MAWLKIHPITPVKLHFKKTLSRARSPDAYLKHTGGFAKMILHEADSHES